MNKEIGFPEILQFIGGALAIIGVVMFFYGFHISDISFWQAFEDSFFGVLLAIIGAILFGVGGACAVGREAANSAVDAGKEASKKIKEFIECVIEEVISFFSAKRELSRVCPDALKAQILEKKKTAVKVGIFDNDSISQTVILKSDYGVADDIQQGQIIYL